MKGEKMDKLISADALRQRMYHDAFETDTEMQRWDSGCWIRYKMFENALEAVPTVDAVPVVRCKDCIHKPQENAKHFAMFPDEICPCLCDDPWYSWIPQDNFFCAYGERREDD